MGLLITSCVSPDTVTNRSFVNHPAMDFSRTLTPVPAPLLTPLGGASATSGGSGACLSCAH